MNLVRDICVQRSVKLAEKEKKMFINLSYVFISVNSTYSLDYLNEWNAKLNVVLLVRDHPDNTSAKGRVGSEKWQFLLTFSTIYADIGWVGTG